MQRRPPKHAFGGRLRIGGRTRSMVKVALLIDGGHLRVATKRLNLVYTPDHIERFALSCLAREENLLRIFYYDCPPYRGQQKLPVSGTTIDLSRDDVWLEDLASRDLFAIRRGTLAFRGWVPKKLPVDGRSLRDDDFRPNFEQKGVDMRIGLDIATLAEDRLVERIILVSADTDMIPAMKHARKKGLQIVAVQLPRPTFPLTSKFMAHADFRREVALPPAACPTC